MTARSKLGKEKREGSAVTQCSEKTGREAWGWGQSVRTWIDPVDRKGGPRFPVKSS